MDIPARRILLRPLVLLHVVCAATFFALPAYAGGNRNVLWEIVSTCLDTSVAQYCAECRWPRSDQSCASALSCGATTEVWAESPNYVALRDPKMCDCPGDFVHGLAIPRAKVTGAEDPRRPNGIWEFAWQVASRRIPDQQSIALVVNPPGDRGQDQLHLHLLRLKPGARAALYKQPLARITRLEQVWKAAANKAAALGLKDYGVLVARCEDGGYLVLVDKVSPEDRYGQKRCRPKAGDDK